MKASELQTFDALGALIVVLDLDGRIVSWNHACSDLTGYSLEEVRGLQLQDFALLPEEVEPVTAVFARLRLGGPPGTFANCWVTKGGERRWIIWSPALTTHPDGGLQFIINCGIDRTESKRAEDALRASEARLGGMIGVAADAIISIDDGQRIVLYNQGAERTFGWPAAEVMGEPLDILLPARFRGVHRQQVRAFGTSDLAARPMDQRTQQIFGLRKTGEEFPAQAAISHLDVGGTRLFTVILRDVTAQARREREWELLEELGTELAATLGYDETLTLVARLAVQHLADLCILDLVDTDGKLRRMKVFHRDPSQAALCDVFQHLPVDQKHAPVVSSVVETGQPRLMAEVSSRDLESMAQSDEHLRILRELGPRSLIAVPLVARGARLGALVLVSTRSSPRYGREDLRVAAELAHRAALAIENVRLHENARKTNDDLREANQHMVSATIRAQEATDAADVARRRVETSERELLAVAEFRDLFMGVVSHDLRNPLTAIAMSARSLRLHGALDEKGQKGVARIISSSERMTRMISQLLDLTRARLGGGFLLEPKLTDLRDVCRTVVQEFQTAIQLEVEGDVSGMWDPDRLAEALSNIAGNASEHATLGTAVVVRVRSEGAEVVVEIMNHGAPIPADMLPFIFEPFRRAERRRSATGNLGLGLYIAKQIVLSSGGTLGARSADGMTTFVMRLPRETPSVSPPMASNRAARRPSP